MRAAIYARRSKEEQAESLETQIDGARRFIAKRGWTLDEAHIFAESGSRAEFVKRRSIGAMLAAAETRAFDVVVVRDETRLGGDMMRTGLLIQNLADAGVRLVHYISGEEVRIDSSTARLVLAVRNYGAEIEREKISSRTRENHERKARRGHVTGGSVYGYRIIDTSAGKTWEIDEEQATIVREIFEWYAAGAGLRRIAKDFNLRRIPPPRAGRRGTGSWSPSSIREMLRRDHYRGLLVWGRQEKVYRGGTKIRITRPASDWITFERPELRIVADDVWSAVQSRNAMRVRMTSSKRQGRQPRYLLSGIGRCAECGGPMQVTNGKSSHDNVRVYMCSWRHNRGPAVCKNALRRPVSAVDAAVLDHLRLEILREEVIIDAIRELRRRLTERSAHGDAETPELEREAKVLRGEIGRLTDALAATTEKPHAVIRAISQREQRLSTVEARLIALRTAPEVHDLEARRLEKGARARLREIDRLLAMNPEHARKALEALLGGPIQFSPVETPEGKRYRVAGEIGLRAFLADEPDVLLNVSPAGFAQKDTRENIRISWALVA